MKADRAPSSAPGIGAPRPMVGAGPAMQQLRSMIDAVAPRDCTVMIHGESGAGKELTARTIHLQSRRCTGAFVAVDCTGLRDTLLESQLFGHVKGAFTGADAPSLGFIRAADGGTLFLDEIGELELKTQAKLLRCIQERCVVPLGSVKPVPVDVRVVCATHRNLREMASKGEFREDLLFRLDVVQVKLPSLRERREDIAALAGHFLGQLADLYGEEPRGLSERTWRRSSRTAGPATCASWPTHSSTPRSSARVR
ncbi:MAG: sigma 54-interacting transcriptional regulator [Phycisphaerales bacterium]